MRQVKRPFAVFDIDGTLIRWQLYHAIADEIIKKYGDRQLHDTIKLARMDWKRRTHPESFKTYETRLVEAYEQVLRNISVQKFEKVAATVFNEYKDQVYRYTRDLIKELKAKDYLLFAISGSQIEIVKMMADFYGFDDYIGTIYEHDGKNFTGNVTVHKAGKHLILDSLVRKHKADYSGSVAVGDSEGDITMLEAVDQPIAMNPSRLLFEHARQNGWKIIVERKNMIYQLEPKNGSYVLA